MEQKKKSVKKNYIFNVSYQILAVLTPLITAPYLSRVLGAEGIGAYSYTASIVTIFAMVATLGTLVYGNREIAYAQTDRAAYSRAFWNVELVTVVSTLLVGICYLGFVLVQTHYVRLYLIQTITLVSVAVNISWLFQGLEEIKKVVIRNIVFRILSVVYIFVFIRSEKDLPVYVLGYVSLELAGHLSIWIYVPRYVDRPRIEDIHPVRHLRGIFALFIPTIATSVYTIFDKTMLGMFTNAKLENGYYEQGMKLAKTALTVVTALEAVMIPRIGALYVKNDQEGIRELMYKAYRFVWFISIPLAFGLYSISDLFVPWFYGLGYDKVRVLLKILCFLIPCIGISNVTGVQYLMSTRRERAVTKTILAGAAVNLTLNLILIPKLFSVGAAGASLVAEALIAGAQLYLVRKELSVRRVLVSGGHYICAGVIMSAFLYLEGRWIPQGATGILCMVVTGGLVYFASLALMRDSLVSGGWNMLKDRVKR